MRWFPGINHENASSLYLTEVAALLRYLKTEADNG